MELRELETVVAVADHGSLTEAAKALSMSRSAVSHSITKLEAELGTKLFRRLPRGMAPTAAGDALLGPARRALWEVESASDAVAAVEGLLAGNLHVVAIRTFRLPLPELVAAFARLHPRVVVTVHQPQEDMTVGQLVRSGECEIGVMRVMNVPDDLHVTPIGDERSVVIMANDHPLAGHATIALKDLDGERMIAPKSGTPLRVAFDRLFTRNRLVLDVVAEAESSEMMVELARSGVGLTVASVTSRTLTVPDDARAIPLDPPLVQALGLVTRSGDLSPATAAFRDLAPGFLTGAGTNGPLPRY
jgi:LysR family cyn operon transcriptional activator